MVAPGEREDYPLRREVHSPSAIPAVEENEKTRKRGRTRSKKKRFPFRKKKKNASAKGKGMLRRL